MVKTTTKILSLLSLLLVFLFSSANAGIIDLTEFYSEEAGVTVYNSSSARIDEKVGSIGILINDPFGGDENGIGDLTGVTSLTFEYDYFEVEGTEGSNPDMFSAVLFTNGNWDPLFSHTVLEVFDTEKGTVTWDLSGLDPKTEALGLIFYLASVNSTYTSYVTINNVYLTTGSSEVAPVPEPATIILLFSGLGLLAFLKRKK